MHPILLAGSLDKAGHVLSLADHARDGEDAYYRRHAPLRARLIPLASVLAAAAAVVFVVERVTH
jgi:hypothetical protein